MLFVLHNFQQWDLTQIDWGKSFEENGIDSLESTAVITSIEHEFHTVFEDRLFENMESLEDVKRYLVQDHNVF